jgi:hypothetical protein
LKCKKEEKFYIKKPHVPYSLCPLTLIPNRQQKLYTGDIKFKESEKTAAVKRDLRLLRGTGVSRECEKEEPFSGKREREEDDERAERWRWSLLQ